MILWYSNPALGVLILSNIFFKAVNNFLNNVTSSTTPSSDAAAIIQIASDEPTQLEILTGFVTEDDGVTNSNNLKQNFPTVPGALTNIMKANNDPNIVQANVAVINSIRSAK
jgi:hypothetical protein